MEFVEAREKRATVSERKVVEVEKELCEALACMFEAKQEF